MLAHRILRAYTKAAWKRPPLGVSPGASLAPRHVSFRCLSTGRANPMWRASGVQTAALALARRLGQRGLRGAVKGRGLSTQGQGEPVDRIKQLAAYFSPGYLRLYAIVGGVSVACYMIISTGYRTASFFSGITIWDTMKVGFFTGLLCGGVVTAVLGVTSSRFFLLRPERVYNFVLAAVKKDPTVVNKLGTPVAPLSDFKAYTFTSGGIRWDAEERAKYQGFFRKWYRPTRLQLIFSVKGPKAKGMISMEVEGSFAREFLIIHKALDVLDTEERFILQGREDKTVYKGHIALR
mmetsp:Transcript_10187/g.19573  ORF Transcript_10187/g.19573 Transcript_10187/m.19573 type:complete len:293 (-) Transcript_10187:283-1161(-)